MPSGERGAGGVDGDPQPGHRAWGSGGADHVGHSGGVPGAETPGRWAATGRKLEKPVCHYSLNWARDEKLDRQEMRRAAEASLKALGLERHQALIVPHRDGQPHVHVIANRVDPESGKAADWGHPFEMGTANWHVYQVLMKHSSLMRNFVNRHYPDRSVPIQIRFGVSIKNTSEMVRRRRGRHRMTIQHHQHLWKSVPGYSRISSMPNSSAKLPL